MMVKNFRFEQDGAVALSAFPESAEAVDWLYDQGIRTVISLHPVPEAAQRRMSERGIDWKLFLIDDWAEGVPEGIDELFDHLRSRGGDQPPALVHCQGGGGRAGTFYAAYLVSQGVSVAEAVARVPGDTRDVQKAFLHGFAAGLKAGAGIK
ncbi:MAG: protein-tyrosine phosphatase family protein [Actinomycetota bacterium]